MLHSNNGRTSPPPLLARLFSRRARLLLVVCLFLVFVSLALFSASVYIRSLVQGRQTEYAELMQVNGDLHGPHHTRANRSEGGAGHTRGEVPATPKPRPPPPDLGDPKTARLPSLEDETQVLARLLAEESQHGEHVFDPVHNHTHEVLTPAQEARMKRQAEEDAASLIVCQKMQSELGIVPGRDWGKANGEQRHDWWVRDCDAVLGLSDYRKFLDAHPELFLPVKVPADRVSPGNRTSSQEVIAICISTTTRYIQIEDIEELTLFKSLLPSISDTVDEGFEYWVYLLYDAGDPYLDKDETRRAIQRWFDARFIGPLLQRGIHSRLVLTVYKNVLRKPGPAFNYMTHLAFIDGVDWIYRINDDTYFMSPFAAPFVAALKALGPPYGVVGPMCREGATAILTHDFTHRTHHEIMSHHYPPPLSDWWMDDWVSRVYGQSRTKRLSDVVVKHLIKTHGTRYNIDLKHKLLLGTEIEKGRRQVERWLSDRGMQAQLLAYQNDEFKFWL